MTPDIEHMHEDIEELKRDVAVIKYILSQEGELTPEARRKLEEARETDDSEYVELS